MRKKKSVAHLQTASLHYGQRPLRPGPDLQLTKSKTQGGRALLNRGAEEEEDPAHDPVHKEDQDGKDDIARHAVGGHVHLLPEHSHGAEGVPHAEEVVQGLRVHLRHIVDVPDDVLVGQGGVLRVLPQLLQRLLRVVRQQLRLRCACVRGKRRGETSCSLEKLQGESVRQGDVLRALPQPLQRLLRVLRQKLRLLCTRSCVSCVEVGVKRRGETSCSFEKVWGEK